MKSWAPRHVVALVAIIGATIVACTGNDGWGWLIFAAIVIA